MRYISTRGGESVSPSYALLHGLAENGGLYVPETFPEQVLCLEELENKSYQQIAVTVLEYFFPNFSGEELEHMVHAAYRKETFDRPEIVPLHSIDAHISAAELFHGRTLAFKDLALSVFPYMLTAAKKQEHEERDILILTATSGDTGKAALEGFRDVEGTNIMVFYPSEGVSPIQAMQMKKQEGDNVKVCAIEGNFDDAQRFLKQVFTDEETNAYAHHHGLLFSSANSINIGRLLPQVVYYAAVYGQLVTSGCIDEGGAFDVIVPTGNFGNILAAYFAKKMGIPIRKLYCASNSNRVLADFFATGVYDMNREFYTTISPSMDIVESSNFERFLYYAAGEDAEKTASWMKSLRETGRLEVSEQERKGIEKEFGAAWIGDEETQAVIAQVYNSFGYLLDPHTAVGFGVYLHTGAKEAAPVHTVLMATAHPFKFPPAVSAALELEAAEDPFQTLEDICACTGMHLPKPIEELKNKPIRFSEIIQKEEMKAAVRAFIEEKAK